ncbi:MAG: PKD domain-containing protein [Elusimicrobiota bacterium]
MSGEATTGGALRARAVAALAALLLSFGTARADAQGVCAVVKLEILQKVTLEREAFDANLKLTNSMSGQPLEYLDIDINIFANGQPAGQLFFVKVANLSGTSAVDGTGTVQPASTADISWLIIPSTGAGGTSALGTRYDVSATIFFMNADSPRFIRTFDVPITVKPQPSIRLEYVLPFEVFGDEPLTEEIEPVEPFPLGVRVTNIGYGPARNFQIESGQPRIVDNKQGLAVDFRLLGTYLEDRQIDNTLLIPFGDVAPDQAKTGAWLMSSTLSGRFLEFEASFTHSAELGGELTSLLQEVATHTLIKDVLVDLPGRDQQFDFLVNTTTARAEIKHLLDNGDPLDPDIILETDQPEPIPVVTLPSGIEGVLSGTDPTVTLRISGSIPAHQWIHTSVPDPTGGQASLVSVVREDGRELNARNFWTAKHFNTGTLAVSHRVHLLDFDPQSTGYRLTFEQQGLDAAPDAVGDLAAATGPGGGSVHLTWSATGEDGSTGDVLGGRVLIWRGLPDATADPGTAQVSFATNTAAGAPQAFLLGGLPGNATHHINVFLQDTGGSVSEPSNRATAYARPNPPKSLTAASKSPASLTAAWAPGNNQLPIEYQVSLALAPGGPAAQSSPFLDTLTLQHTFADLAPNTAYFFKGAARDPDTQVASPEAEMGSLVTFAEQPAPGELTDPTVGSFRASWGAAGNPEGTWYEAQASVSEEFTSIDVTSGTYDVGALFTGLTQRTTYYVRVKARNSAGEDTAYTTLGHILTKDFEPPAPGEPPLEATATHALAASWTANGTPPGSLFRAELSRTEDFAVVERSSETYDLRASFEGLDVNTPYHARVAVYLTSISGFSEYTSLGSRHTFAAQPGTRAEAPTFTDVTQTGFTASWTSGTWSEGYNPPDTEYRLELSTTTDPWWTGVSSATRSLGESFSGLDPTWTYHLRVKAANGDGIPTEYTTLGSAPPTVSILNAIAGTYLTSPSTTVAVAFSGAGTQESVAFKLDDAAQPGEVSGNGAVYQLSGLSDGAHRIDVAVTDETGAGAEDSAEFIVDTTGPLLFVSSPAANANGWHNRDVTFIYAAEDPPSADGLPGSGLDAEASELGEDTLAEESAGWTAEALAVDNVGNATAFRETGIKLDKTPPALTITSPAGGRYVATRDEIGIDFTALDNFDADPELTARLELESAGSGAPGKLNGPVEVENGRKLEPLDLTAGVWRLTLSATDQADNPAFAAGATFEVVHDIRAPRTSVTVGAPRHPPAPAEGEPEPELVYLTGTTPVTASSIDDLVADEDGTGLGVATQTVKVNGAEPPRLLFENPEPAIGAVFENTFTLDDADGQLSLLAEARDTLDNQETGQALSLQIDNTPPTVNHAFSIAPVVRAPKEEQWFAEDFQIIWSADDGAGSGVAHLDGPTGVTVEAKGTDCIGRSVDNVNNEAALTVTVNLDKTAPEVDAGADAAAEEGAELGFSGTVIDNLDKAVQYGWDFGDEGTAGGDLTPGHTYLDEGIYQVTLAATDHAAHAASDTLMVTVTNAPPIVTAGPDRRTEEGSVVGISATFTDAGILDTHTAEVDWGDGTTSAAPLTEENGSGSLAAEHVYADNDVYAVRITVTDNDGDSGEAALAITVDNVAPTIAAGADLTANEGSVVSLGAASSGLVSWWRGEDDARDSADGNHGTLINSATFAPGMAGWAFSLDGSGYVSVPDSANLRLGKSQTVEAWIYPTANSGDWVRLAGKGRSHAGRNYGLWRERYGGLLFQVFDSRNAGCHAYDLNLPATIAPVGEWTHVAGTYDGARAKLYVNGVLQVDVPCTLTPVVTDDPLTIGYAGFHTFFKGLIDEAVVYDEPLTPEQIQTRHAAGGGSPLAGAVFNDKGTLDTHTATIDWGDGTAAETAAVTGFPFGPPGSAAGQNGTIAGSHVYADDGDYTVTVCVKDDEDAELCDELNVTVNNVTPTIAAGADRTAPEGSVVSLDPATFDDKGTLDAHTAAIDWGDGTPTEAGTVSESPAGPPGSTSGADGTISGSHVYADNGAYTVTVTVTDDEGASASDTLTVTVDNAAPTLDVGPDQAPTEGMAISLAPSSFNDPGTLDTHTATIDWGDGTAPEAAAVTQTPFGPPGDTAGADGSVALGSHVYADNGAYTVTVTVTDDEGASATDTLTVTADNAAPTLDAGPDQAATEGMTISLAPSAFNDPGTLDTHTATIDWGDGSAIDAAAVIEAPHGPPGDTAGADGAIAGSHVYADNGAYTVTVTVTDDEGASATDTFTVTADNAAPTLDAGADQTAPEGGVVSLDPATFNDKGTLDTHTAAIDWGDGSPVEAGAVTESPSGPPGSTAGADGAIAGSHVYADDGSYTVNVCVKDDEDAERCEDLSVTVENAAPTVKAGADNTAAAEGWIHIGGTIELRTMVVSIPGQPGTPTIPIGPDAEHPVTADFIRFHDMGTADTHTASIDWGDGTALEHVLSEDIDEDPQGPPGSTTGSSGTIKSLHQYTANGIYTLVATVTDDEGASGSDSLLVKADIEPPQTTISHTASSSTAPGTPVETEVFLNQTAMNSLGAVDPVINGIAFDVQWTFYRDLTIDGPEAPFIRQNVEHEAVPFNLAQEGVHRLEYFSVDKRGNEEGYRLDDEAGHKFITIGVDHTPPQTTLTIGNPVKYEFGQTFISPKSKLALDAADPVSGGVASGVREILYRIDDGAPIVYTGEFSLAEGTHTLAYWSPDRVDNYFVHVASFGVSKIMSPKKRAAAGKKKSIDMGGNMDFYGDAISNGPIRVFGSAFMDGDVEGPEITVQGSAVITGTQTIVANPLHPAPFDLTAIKEQVLANNLAEDPDNPIAEYLNNSVLTLNAGASLTLPSGNYLLSGLRATAGAELKIIGQVGILVEGPITINSAEVNAIDTTEDGQHAEQLALFSNQADDVRLAGSGRVGALLYAPEARVVVTGSAKFGGSLFAGTLDVNGNAVSLSSATVPTDIVTEGKSKGGKPAAAGSPSVSAGGADPTFALRDLYVFPNPAVGGSVPTIHIAVGVADKVTIRIYNVAGQQVHQATMESAPPVIDDGSGPKYAYEYAWDGRIPSGVYLYTVVADKSGEASIRKAGKFAVVR